MVYLCSVPGALAVTGSLVPINYNPILLKQSLIITIIADKTTTPVGTQVFIQTSAYYPNNTSLGPGYTITLTCSPAGGSFSSTTAQTHISNSPFYGQLISGFNSVYTAGSTPGTYTITATVSDPSGNYRDGTAQASVVVTNPTSTPVATPQQATATAQAPSVTPTVAAISMTPTPTQAATNTTAAVSGDSGLGGLMPILPYIIAAIVIILLILLILFYLWNKKTLKILPKETIAPCDGKTEIPVKVMFVNGFGTSRKPRSDVEVEMKSTAGTIKNVVLPSSRDFAEAILVAPREFGQATISATANNKTVNATVNFTYKHATFDLSVTPNSIPSDGRSSANVKLQIKDENGNVIAPIVERTADLKTTLGAITSPVRIPSKATEVNATITAGEVSGTAVIYVVCEDIKGEGKVSFKGLPKRFCMHCGTRMDMDAASCPNCGLTPPSGVDTKSCPTCGTVIPESAGFCYQCGAKQPGK